MQVDLMEDICLPLLFQHSSLVALYFQSKPKNSKKPQMMEKMCINTQTAAMNGKNPEFSGAIQNLRRRTAPAKSESKSRREGECIRDEVDGGDNIQFRLPVQGNIQR